VDAARQRRDGSLVSPTGKILIGIAAVVLALLLVRQLAEILTPFLIAFGLAYVLDPAASRLTRMGAGRGTAAGVVTCGFFALMLGVLVLMAPMIQGQIAALIDQLMILGDRIDDAVRPMVRRMMDGAAPPAPAAPQGQTPAPAPAVPNEVVKEVLGWTGTVLGGLWAGGLALFSLISILVITPVVVFYLLRDWPKIVARLELWVPPRHALVTRDLLLRIDSRLSGFLRGQALVCILLGAIYAGGLALVGLESGIVLGMVAGILSFIPYVGTLAGFVAGVGLAFVQFDTMMPVMAVAAVFGVGQFIEGMVLTPYLVGERVGLHPVWVIFALMAGGALFGFVGVLLAVPVAAALGVVVEHVVQRYLQSGFYTRTEG